MTLAVGVLVSGRGSNLESLLKAVEKGRVQGAEIRVVVSNRGDAKALSIAKRHGVRAEVVDDRGLSSEELGSKIARVLSECGVSPGEGLILLAGFMKILPKSFIELYRGKVMNIHPSLLPAFPGLDAQRQALESGVKVTGCTVHFVVPQVDAGPIIIQRAVTVEEGDDVDSLSARILRQEHRAYPEALRLYSVGKLKVMGRRVSIAP